MYVPGRNMYRHRRILHALIQRARCVQKKVTFFVGHHKSCTPPIYSSIIRAIEALQAACEEIFDLPAALRCLHYECEFLLLGRAPPPKKGSLFEIAVIPGRPRLGGKKQKQKTSTTTKKEEMLFTIRQRTQLDDSYEYPAARVPLNSNNYTYLFFSQYDTGRLSSTYCGTVSPAAGRSLLSDGRCGDTPRWVVPGMA